MSIESRVIKNRDEWLSWRRDDVTASAAAALLGVHAHTSNLQLYMDKAGILPLESDSPAMRRGRLLEPLALELIREARPDWEVWKAEDYVRDPQHRLGATPDVIVREDVEWKRLGIVQVKSIEPHIFERTWRDPESGEIIPPVWIGIQAALEAHLTGADFAFIGALRVGHSVEFDLIPVPHTPDLIKRLELAADGFWEAVEKREPPAADYMADAELVRLLHPITVPQKTVDLSGNNRLGFMAEEYARLSEIAAKAEKERKAIKAELLDLMGDAEFAIVNGEVVASAKLITKKPYEVRPKPYRDVRFRGVAA